MDKSKIGMEIAATLYKYMDMNTKTVKEADFSKIALDVVKLFAIPDVIKSVSYYDNGKCKIKGKCKYKPYRDGDCYDCSKVI